MSEELAQDLYVVARERFAPATFRTQGTEPTTEPPHPITSSAGDRFTFWCDHAYSENRIAITTITITTTITTVLFLSFLDPRVGYYYYY